ncbi:hypothetical protein L486_05052 [Kwoniella mangroviensis CBS 10435]|uniref:GH18 domain-containing protein n=1 Tax=Kwoniella mangroviensis CBS 10435 TaxID=1331196 RepID=A0A1B9IPU7_9TREE|nr:hypothetical protein L486_05052 [Kwoniella mangroviensis CBS 10435]
MTNLGLILGILPFIPSITGRAISNREESQRRCDSCEANGNDWSGYRNIGYFTNWGIYDPQNFLVTNITARDFTHINYAFANVDADNGTVYLDDPEADTQFEYPNDDLDEEGNNLYGNLKQLYLLKQQNRHLKTLLSIGGWTYSTNFANIIDSKWRETFVNSSITILNNFGFDGLDIDFGNPEGEQGPALTELLKSLRSGLDQAASKNGGGYYELSVAVGCGETGWGGLDTRGMDKYLDFWNLMAYDFSGDWTPTALPASNLHPDTNSANDQNASGSQCFEHYLGEGIDSKKLNLGMPLYGTGFNGTQGMWTNWTDIGGGDYDQAGNYDIKHLPLDGAVMFYNKTLGSSWSFNDTTGHVVSFDTPQVALQKAKYVMKNNLGGMMYWSIDQDYTKLQSDGKPSGRIWPGIWDRLKGHSRKWNYGKLKGKPFNLGQKRSVFSINEKLAERGFGLGWNRSDLWGEWDDLKSWKLHLDDGICLNIGYSLVDTVKTAFEKYGGGLEKRKNNLNYPNSDVDKRSMGL